LLKKVVQTLLTITHFTLDQATNMSEHLSCDTML